MLKYILFIISLSFVGYAQDLKEVSAEEFIAQDPSLERKAIINFITNQFNGKQAVSITQEQLDHIWANKKNRRKFSMYRFQIIDQKLYADSYDLAYEDFRATLKYFQNLIQHYKIQDVDFIIYRRDRMPININGDIEKEAAEFPAILMSKNINSLYEKDKILIPDNFVANRWWGKLAQSIIQENANNPWDQKIEKIFWRGSTSNGTYNIDNFDKLPRLTLVMLSKLYPDLIDAQFSKYIQQFSNDLSGKKMKRLLKILWKEDPQVVKEADHLKYKYLISIDGNTCAWSRVPWIMLSNSVLVKQETDNMEWFYPAMKPYVHYVPINEKLTDIFSQLEWMKSHDEDLKQISKNARDFAINNLMPEHIDAHMVIVLNQYHKLHQGKKLVPSLLSFDEMMSLSTLFHVLIKLIKDSYLKWKWDLEDKLIALGWF